jgi:eukaryotic-like serine/threonine-protein kinase
MKQLRALIHEIHRRSLWQVIGIYLVGSWIGYQVILGVTDGLSLPDWVPPFAFVLFVIGLPIVVATAFINEGGPGMRSRPEPAGLPDLQTDPLAAWQQPAEPAPPADGDNAARGVAPPHVLTWRRALGAGAAAFALLGASAAGYSGMRVAGVGPVGTLIAAGRIDTGAPIVLAEFRASGVDALLARALTDALRVDLEQSRVVTLAQPSFVEAALRRMELAEDAPFDEATARTLAVREGLAAVIAGEVTAAAGQWAVTVRILEPATGAALAAYRESVADSARVVDALGRASRKLRAKIGESLRDVRASEPLAQVTTHSLEALRLYAQAVHLSTAGVEHRDRAIALLEQAVAIDTAFAMAYRKLGIEYGNDPFAVTRAAEMTTRAYRHLDRLSEPERYMTLGTYHGRVTRDRAAQLAAYQTLFELYPTYPGAANNYAFALSGMRQKERAAAAYRHAAALDTTNALPFSNYVFSLIEVGRLDDAVAALDTFRTRFADNPHALMIESEIAAARGDYENSLRTAESLLAQATGQRLRMIARGHAVSAYAALGRFERARGHAQQGYREASQLGAPGALYIPIIMPALASLVAGVQSPSDVIAEIDAHVARYPLGEAPLLDRPYLELAQLYALAGDASRARAMLSAFRAEMPDAWLRANPELDAADGMLAVAEGRHVDAVRLFESADATWTCTICALPGIALAHDRAGNAEAAIVAYRRYMESTSLERRWIDSAWRGHVLERLAHLHDEAGRSAEARQYYARLIELWSAADPPLRPRVDAARRRLAELMDAG